VEVLVQHHARFLRFLSFRVADPATAEDILHSAYIKALEHENQLREDESVVAWFYRILRNSVIDHYRRNAARNSAHERYASGLPVSYEAELRREACACVENLVGELKAEYRDAIERIDLAEESVEAFAKAKNITVNNASVRLHRAFTADATQSATCAYLAFIALAGLSLNAVFISHGSIPLLHWPLSHSC
jgi:RNA polymerase sigma-70 factor (ECF subfamily)